VRADVTNEIDARRMIDAAIEKLGGLHILYNNAGVGNRRSAISRSRARAMAARHRHRSDRRDYGDLDRRAPHPKTRRRSNHQYGLDGGSVSASPGSDLRRSESGRGELYPFVRAVGFGAEDSSELCMPGDRRHADGAARARSGNQGRHQVVAPSKMLHAEDIADAVAYLIRDDSLFGCSLEVRPTGRQIVDPRPAPGSKR